MLLFPNVLKNHTSLHCSRDAKVLLYMLYITTKCLQSQTKLPF